MKSSKKILVAEDDLAIRTSLREELKFDGFEVLEAVDGEDAWTKINSEVPDLVVLDLMMPKLNGLAVLKKIRESKTTNSLPVIVLTNLDADGRMIDQMVALKPSFYFLKQNINANEIPAKVRECLNMH